MKIRYLFLALLSCVVLLGGIAFWMTKTSTTHSTHGALWQAQFLNLHAQVTKITRPIDRPLVVNFWATWCGPCQEELTDLMELATHFKGRADFVGVAVDNTENVQQFVKVRPITYPIYLGQADVLALMQAEGNTVGGLPFTVVYTKDGQQVASFSGKIQKETLAALLLKLSKSLE